MKDDFYMPAPADIALQSRDNKQGRSTESLEADEAEKIRAAFSAGQEQAYSGYTSLIDRGLAREIARINLPLSLYTEWYWQIDLHNLFHFLELRLDSHAQKEIRAYAEVLFNISKKVAPLCCLSFERHVLEAVSFSGEEFAELKHRLGAEAADEAGGGNGGKLSGQALERFEEKLRSGKQS
jgi:thymidylate synthase (FAD)